MPEAPFGIRRALFGGERVDMGSPGARVLVLLGVVAALVAAGYLWMARPRPEPVAGPSHAPTLSGTAPSPQGSMVVVHVHGKVRRPGVVSLPAGSRIADAIKSAGGARPGIDTGPLNLARKLTDGEQISVGVRAPAQPPAASGGAAAGTGGPLDLNAATVQQLDQLPGVGPVLAQRIIDHRTQRGGFRSVEQLQEVSGIGARRFADLKNLVRV
ncbi:helix-hairpin-helix domain-containing protein [Actinomadura sp. 21ATH]|uniref:helix-hairpin-helix domain-containing protein n=1 Tax=Actinomadura sp. 21ATH TaxID=1735444 RepID=UPI0035C0F8D0